MYLDNNFLYAKLVDLWVPTWRTQVTFQVFYKTVCNENIIIVFGEDFLYVRQIHW